MYGSNCFNLQHSSNNLNLHHPIFRRSLAGFLLVLFAFSITPRKALHDWMVSHTDGVSIGKSDVAQLSKAGFNCTSQNLVAESPFTAVQHALDLSFYPDYAFLSYAFLFEVDTPAVFFYSLRGPPAIG